MPRASSAQTATPVSLYQYYLQNPVSSRTITFSTDQQDNASVTVSFTLPDQGYQINWGSIVPSYGTYGYYGTNTLVCTPGEVGFYYPDPDNLLFPVTYAVTVSATHTSQSIREPATYTHTYSLGNFGGGQGYIPSGVFYAFYVKESSSTLLTSVFGAYGPGTQLISPTPSPLYISSQDAVLPIDIEPLDPQITVAIVSQGLPVFKPLVGRLPGTTTTPVATDDVKLTVTMLNPFDTSVSPMEKAAVSIGPLYNWGYGFTSNVVAQPSTGPGLEPEPLTPILPSYQPTATFDLGNLAPGAYSISLTDSLNTYLTAFTVTNGISETVTPPIRVIQPGLGILPGGVE